MQKPIIKTIAVLLTLAMILPTVSAAITFTITPNTQTVAPGQAFNVDLNVNNDQPFWGFSLKIDENGPITYASSVPSNRLTGSFNGITQNTPDRITPYAIFAGNTPGITAGNGQVFRITYNAGTTPGTYQFTPAQLTVSDQNGNAITGATITGASVTVQEETGPVVGYTMPTLTGNVEEIIEVPVCLSNTEEQAVTGADITITHNEEIARVRKVDILQGTGNSQITEGSTHIVISGLNIRNADCNAQTGANVAKIHYYLRALGTTPLTVQTATATPYSPQQFANHNGQIQVQATQVIKTCEPNQGVITKGHPVTITYKVHNPFPLLNIGGIDEQDIYNNNWFTPTLPPLNLRAGSLLASITVLPNIVRTVQTKAPQPFLLGPGTFYLYSILYTSNPATPDGDYAFDIAAPPPPALEISDEHHQEVTPILNGLCYVKVITSCQGPEDCDDHNWCNGQETCVIDPQGQGVCQPGTPPNCDDGNICHNNYCENNACHHDQIPGCETPSGGGGGGGGGAGRLQQFVGCDQCKSNADWECCGMDMPQIRQFCERPETHENYCKRTKPIAATPALPSMPAPAPEAEQPAQEEYVEQPEELQLPGSQGPSLAGKAITRTGSESAELGIMPWIIGLIILLLVGGAFGAYTIFRGHAPAQTQPPVPPTIPTTPIEPPAPIILPPIKPEPVKPTKHYDPYEAQIRRRLAKIMKAKRR